MESDRKREAKLKITTSMWELNEIPCDYHKERRMRQRRNETSLRFMSGVEHFEWKKEGKKSESKTLDFFSNFDSERRVKDLLKSGHNFHFGFTVLIAFNQLKATFNGIWLFGRSLIHSITCLLACSQHEINGISFCQSFISFRLLFFLNRLYLRANHFSMLFNWKYILNCYQMVYILQCLGLQKSS